MFGLTKAICALTCAVRDLGSNDTVKQAILKRMDEMESNIMLKVSEIKAAVAEIKKNNAEAFAELGTRIADLQKQIDDLIASQADPNVTDEVFEADLAELKVSAKALADIVPGSPTPEPPPA